MSNFKVADFVLVGGGLQNALIALAVLEARPSASLILLESAAAPLGNHTWCFHAGDVPPSAWSLVSPLVVASWPGYDVRFPDGARRVPEPYFAISSERVRGVLERTIQASPNARLLTNTRAVRVEANEVTLADGRVLSGSTVVDARGPSSVPFEPRAFQKFVGRELELGSPCRLELPLLMDAMVPQTDGFRFFYVLPLGERRILVEDTYFSDGPELDAATLRREIDGYAAASDFDVRGVVREEVGVLPLPLRSMEFRKTAPLSAGYSGGFFHPATGYSFPVALRVALELVKQDAGAEPAHFERFLREHAGQFRFGAFLNRLLFTAFRPEDRWNALARFYRLPVDVIRRFYALETTAADRARILCGRPPRGLSLPTLFERRALA